MFRVSYFWRNPGPDHNSHTVNENFTNIYLAQLIICIGLCFEPERNIWHQIEIKRLNHNFQSIIYKIRKFHKQKTIIPCPNNHLKWQGVPHKSDNLIILVCFLIRYYGQWQRISVKIELVDCFG